MVEGTVNGVHVSTILLDTGSDCIIVSDKIIRNIDRKICKEKTIFDYLGRQDKFPVVKCLINCKYFNGWTDVVVAPLKFTSVLLGTVTPSEPSHFPANKIDTGKSESFSSDQVSTRFTPRLKVSSLNPLELDAPPLVAMECTTEHFLESQISCPTLENVRKNIVSNKCFKMKDGSIYKFVKENNVVYRVCVKSKLSQNEGLKTLVLPKNCRAKVLKLAHESIVAGHFSHRKTKANIFTHFYWPGASLDIRNFCRSCDC